MISQIYGINDDIITHEFIGYICDSLVDEIDFVSVLFSISAFLTDLKRIQTPHSFFGTSEQIKPLQPVGQAAEFKFESKFEPLRPCPAGHLALTGNHSIRLFQKTIEGLMAELLGPRNQSRK